jgi:hypothetical protein
VQRGSEVAEHQWGLGPAKRIITASAVNEDGTFEANTLTVDIVPDYLEVDKVTQTSTGFHVAFDQAFDVGALNLYGSTDVGNEGLADVTLVGKKTGAVRGSIVVDQDAKGFTFIRTGGVLADDTYTMTLSARSNGLLDLHGRALDGNGDGTNGDDFVFGDSEGEAFVISTAGLPVLSIGDFMRGPGQHIDVPATGAGIPIKLSNGTGLIDLQFEIKYEGTKFNLAAVGSVLQGLTVDFKNFPEEGRATFHVTGLSRVQLGTAAVTLFTLDASVPKDAPYTSKEIMDIRNASALTNKETRIGVVDDDGLHIVGFIGDTSGNGRYSSLDLQRMQRVLL